MGFLLFVHFRGSETHAGEGDMHKMRLIEVINIALHIASGESNQSF
jgi:hypothetical protein